MTPLPDDFVMQTKAFMSGNLWQTLEQGLSSEPPVSIRLNPLKCADGGWTVADGDGRVGWCGDGWYLRSRPAFTFDPLLHAGAYYVQEASSMFLDAVMRHYVASEPVMMLDLCAAPGGKSTVARAALPEGSLLVTNEPVRSRAQVLAENMIKFGHPDVMVTSNYPADYGRSGLTFDVIVTDVPCSGEGMFRKDNGARTEWSLQNVDRCWRLQREIVSDVWPCLRDGGLLIYSTCTFNLHEDELNVRYIAEELGADVLPVTLDDGWGIAGSLLDTFKQPVYRFLPGASRGEGLFMAVLRKHGSDSQQCNRTKPRKAQRDRQTKAKPSPAQACKAWLKAADNYDIVTSGEAFTAIPKAWRNVYDEAVRSLHVLTAGIPLGQQKGRDITPAHGLALSAAFNTSSFATAELSYAQAVSYLRKETLTLSPDVQRGYVLLTFNGMPLGFAKNIGSRANNLYPAEWKIKSTYVPEAYNAVIVRQ